MDIKIPFMKPAFTPSRPVALTELGKRKAQEMTMEGPRFDVLNALNENGPSSIKDISDTIHVDSAKVYKVVKSLMHEGYIQAVG